MCNSYIKGKLVSRELKDIVNEVKKLTKKGYFDFSFISQDSSSYLKDKNIDNGLVRLIDEIENIKGVKSARILYLYPMTTTHKMIQKIANSSIFHSYFDIPLQHISDKMLKVMKRGFKKDKTMEIIKKISKIKDAYIRTAFIVGHPAESKEDFEELLEYIQESNFDMINIFAYSDEEGTPAFFRNDKVDNKEIKRRLKSAKKVVNKKLKQKLKSYITKEIKVVLNGFSNETNLLYSAKNIKFAPEIDPEILINDSKIKNLKIAQVYKVLITDSIDTQLIGTILSSENLV